MGCILHTSDLQKHKVSQDYFHFSNSCIEENKTEQVILILIIYGPNSIHTKYHFYVQSINKKLSMGWFIFLFRIKI